ncbi:MAG TPA: YdeI/OmpD-associated family protein [Candidatus Limnocylindrales bacterium]|nr:YdeI/OmpD-associated family protein [Candidatus Limnocylindrales bacterium]
MGLDDLDQVLVTSRAEWREWLAANADTSPGIWLVLPRRGNDDPAPTYDEVVEEALCFGWIDSTVRTRDERFALQLLTPRKPTSTWSASNKERLARLIPAGLMTERGLRVVEAAQANGSWEILDSVERLEVPDDLAAALDADPTARAYFDELPPGVRKQNLYFVISAKRPETRAARIARIVTAAREGRRAVG